MRKWVEYTLPDKYDFVKKLTRWGCQFEHFIILNSNRNLKNKHLYQKYDLVAACIPLYILETDTNNGFDSLKEFHLKHNDWIFGSLSYDLKNGIENLQSKNPDLIGFPDLFFYVPSLVFIVNDNCLRIEYLPDLLDIKDINDIFYKITHFEAFVDFEKVEKIIMHQRIDKKEYVEIANKIKAHIKYGDIYELNFCQEFFSENAIIYPIHTYDQLCTNSPAPFSAFLKNDDKYLISSSPERFIAKQGNKIISQPIKGTIKRGSDAEEDIKLKHQLSSDEKERAENIMIVDLVRNDLSKTALKGSICVEELCEIYTYPQVHQMISTICSKMNDLKFDITDVIRYAFPMGSMTGAPKIKAMELIDTYEKTKRGLYSGSVGYISPNKDFDFNVVIRSITYNSTMQYLSFQVGSAITYQSDAELEYEECMLKAKGMIMALEGVLGPKSDDRRMK